MQHLLVKISNHKELYPKIMLKGKWMNAIYAVGMVSRSRVNKGCSYQKVMDSKVNIDFSVRNYLIS